MSKVLVLNRANNFGDCLNHMRGLKEWKDQHLDMDLYFASNHYLHYIAAKHTDLFKEIWYFDHAISAQEVSAVNAIGFDRVVEFVLDWGMASRIGILKAWTQSTLGFTPTTNQPYFIATDDEKIAAQNHLSLLRRLGFRKFVIIQPEAPSDVKRSFVRSDWDRLVNLFPDDVGVIFPCPVVFSGEQPLTPKRNLLMLPGYGLGETSELLKLVDMSLMVHGGMLLLGHAVDAKNMIHVIFNETINNNIHWLNEEQGNLNIAFPSNVLINWEGLKAEIDKRL